MATNDVYLLTTPDAAHVLVGAAIAYAKVVEQIQRNGLNTDSPSVLVLFANALDRLGREAPQTHVQKIFELASRHLMETELEGS